MREGRKKKKNKRDEIRGKKHIKLVQEGNTKMGNICPAAAVLHTHSHTHQTVGPFSHAAVKRFAKAFEG